MEVLNLKISHWDSSKINLMKSHCQWLTDSLKAVLTNDISIALEKIGELMKISGEIWRKVAAKENLN